MKVEQLTCSIGAEVSGISLGDASRDTGLAEEIRALLLQHKVLFFRDQDITRGEHAAFARHFGDLEDHPVAGSDPDHPGLVQIYRSDKREGDKVWLIAENPEFAPIEVDLRTQNLVIEGLSVGVIRR